MPKRDVSKEGAYKRAIEDYAQFSQFARMSAQFTFGANGGAAAAILSFLTRIINSESKTTGFNRQVVLHGFAIASSCYLFGLLLTMASMYLFARAKKRWGDAWEDTAMTGFIDFNSAFSQSAQRNENLAWICLVVSAIVFGCGSYFAVTGFFRQ